MYNIVHTQHQFVSVYSQLQLRTI